MSLLRISSKYEFYLVNIKDLATASYIGPCMQKELYWKKALMYLVIYFGPIVQPILIPVALKSLPAEWILIVRSCMYSTLHIRGY